VQDNRFLGLLDSDQAIMIHIANPEDFFECINGVAFLDHPAIAEIGDYIQSPEAAEIMSTLGLARSAEPLEAADVESVNQWNAVVSGPITMSISPRRGGVPEWFVAFETSKSRVGQVLMFFADAFGCTVADSLQRRLHDSQSSDEVVSFSGLHFFVQDNHFFCCSDESFANLLQRRMVGEEKVRRAFSANRKYILGFKRSEQVRGEPLVQVFMDPELLPEIFPSVPQEVWDVARYKDIAGVFFEINAPGRHSDSRMQLAFDCWIQIKQPRSELYRAILESKPISRMAEVDFSEATEIFAFSLEASKILNALEKEYTKVANGVSLDSILTQLEKSERVPSGFSRKLLTAFKGSGLKLEFSNGARQPLLVLEVADVEAAKEIVAQLSKAQADFFGVEELLGRIDEGVQFWTWNSEQLNAYREKTRTLVPRADDKYLETVQPTAWSVNGQYVAMSSNSVIEELGTIRSADVFEQSGFFGSILKKTQAHDASLDRPNLIWNTKPIYWRSQVASMYYSARLKFRKAFASSDFSRESFDYRIPLKGVKDADLVRELVKIRIAEAACDTLGDIVVVAQSELYGLRFSMMMFPAEESSEK
jgi:hypothetical protein